MSVSFRLVSLPNFRIFSYVEAASFLVLLLVAMPLKYFADLPVAVSVAGAAHGWIFVAYLVFVGFAARKFSWRPLVVLGAVVASVLPFGPLVFDRLALSGRAERTAPPAPDRS